MLSELVKQCIEEKRPLHRAVLLRRAREVYLLETPDAALIGPGCTPRALRHLKSAAETLIRETRLSKFTVYTSLKIADSLHPSVTEWLLAKRGVVSMAHLRRIGALDHKGQCEVMALVLARRVGSVAKGCAQVELPEAEDSVLEQDFMSASMVAIQERLGSGAIIERRNCGQVVTRNRKGSVTGVFKASQLTGAADVIVWVQWGIGIQVEFKAADGELEPEQKRHAIRWNEVSGGVGYLVAQYDPTADFEVNVAAVATMVEAERDRIIGMLTALAEQRVAA